MNGTTMVMAFSVISKRLLIGGTWLEVILILLLSSTTWADLPHNPELLVSARVPEALPGLRLQWPLNTNACSYGISRAPLTLGITSNAHWIRLAEVPGAATHYQDATAQAGQAYEYQVEKFSILQYQLQSIRTVISAGRDLPLVERRGTVLLLVESAQAGALAAELHQLARDLVGDGWQVIRREVSAQAAPAEVWRTIRSDYEGDPVSLRALLLLGRIPRRLTTQLYAPGAHENETIWADDTLYGVIEAGMLDEQGEWQASAGPVRLAVGRVDLSEMPSFAPASETELLRRYLAKNHQFRHNRLDLGRRAIVDDRFGDSVLRGPARMSWRIFSALFGPEQVSAQECLPTLSSQGYLWLAAGGFSSYTNAGGAITTGHFREANPHIAFALLYGSFLGNWIYPDDLMRAVLASPQYGVASVYGLEVDHCFLYRMGLGETIGESLRAQQEVSRNRFCLNLMGDPTLRLHPVSPPSGVVAVKSEAGVGLSWKGSADPEVGGYYVYRSDAELGPYERLTKTPVTRTSFRDAEASRGRAWYMVRAVKLEQCASGSYWNASQGVFATVEIPSPQPILSIRCLTPRLRSSDASPGRFRIRRSGPADLPLTVACHLGGTAQPGVDYRVAETNLVLAEGAEQAWITLQPGWAAGSEFLEKGMRTVIVNLLAGSGYQVGAMHEAMLVIEPEEEVNLAASVDPVLEGSGKAGEFTLTRSGPARGPMEVSFSLSGTAQAGVDYADPARTVTIPTGAPSVILPITPLNPITDWPEEGRKTVILSLKEGAGYRLGTQREAGVDILRNEPGPVVEIKASVPAAEEAGLIPGEFTITRTGNLYRNLTVHLQPPTGTANGSEYRTPLHYPPRISVTIPYGQASIAIPVIPVNNHVLDPDKTLVWALAPHASYQVGDSKSATVVIKESNAHGKPRLFIGARPEAGSALRPFSPWIIEVHRSGGTVELPFSLHYSGTATNGIHYEWLPNDFLIPAGTNRTQICLRPIPNDRGEGDKTVEIWMVPAPHFEFIASSPSLAQIRDEAYHVWRVKYFRGHQMDPAMEDRLSDPDRDGNCNFIEYLFNLDPNRPDQIPPGTWKISKDSSRLRVRFSYRYNGYSEFESNMTCSTNLSGGQWMSVDAWISRTGEMGPPGLREREIIFRPAPEMGPAVFLRFQFILK